MSSLLVCMPRIRNSDIALERTKDRANVQFQGEL